jgi:alpha/beta hydrolase fold
LWNSLILSDTEENYARVEWRQQARILKIATGGGYGWMKATVSNNRIDWFIPAETINLAILWINCTIYDKHGRLCVLFPPLSPELAQIGVKELTDHYHQFAEGYLLRRDAMIWFWNQYTTSPGERDQITASPLQASTEQLNGLPPALVITAEADVVRDEGEAYANKLREAGVRVTAARFQGTIHGFVMLNALANSAAARGAVALATAWLREEFSAANQVGWD